MLALSAVRNEDYPQAVAALQQLLMLLPEGDARREDCPPAGAGAAGSVVDTVIGWQLFVAQGFPGGGALRLLRATKSHSAVAPVSGSATGVLRPLVPAGPWPDKA